MEKQPSTIYNKIINTNNLNQQNPNLKLKHKQPKGQFSNLIIQMMKKIKKNLPLFKPIKKLKTSIDVIGGQNQLSIYQPTNKLAVFHFGLGNQLDKQIIINGTNLSQLIQNHHNHLSKQFIILPGKAFTFIQFKQIHHAQNYIKTNQFKNIFEQLNAQKQQNKIIIQQISQTQQIQLSLNQKKQKQQQYTNKQTLFYFKSIQYKNLQRLMIFFYFKPQNNTSNNQLQNNLINISNCPSKYCQSNYIPGLHLIQQIISKQQELKLLQWIDKQPWEKLSNRRVQHYGYQFKYGRNQIDKDQIYQHPMPQVFHQLINKLANLIGQLSGQPLDYDQLTINDYFAGHGIPAHFDTHSPFQQYFVAISMLSGIVMDWKKYDGTQTSTYLKQRSMVVFSGQGRYAWLHSIACRKLDNIDNELKHRSRRLSLTFRKIKRTPCKCKYYFYCDSQGYDQNTMKKNNPLLTKYLCQQNQNKLKNIPKQNIYTEYVIKAYNSFGYDFHNKVIPQIKQYLTIQSQNLQKSQMMQNKLLLDIGCGNGQYKKHLNSNKFYYIGVQICEIMLPVEQQMHMDGLNLGFKDQTFDIVLLVAVLHHFTSQRDRIRCLVQARRVLKPKSGVMYVTVFNYGGKKEEYPYQDILLDYCLLNHKVISNNEQKQNNNDQIDIQQNSKQQIFPVFPSNLIKQQGKKTQKGQIFKRYYHLFKQQQLQQIIQKSGLIIQQLKTSKQNIIVKLTKK